MYMHRYVCTFRSKFITFKPLLKWKSVWNESCRSRKTKQKWYSRVFHLRPRWGRKMEFTELDLELQENNKTATGCFHLSPLFLTADCTPASGHLSRPPGRAAGQTTQCPWFWPQTRSPGSTRARHVPPPVPRCDTLVTLSPFPRACPSLPSYPGQPFTQGFFTFLPL